ncbi:hypothetical protein [Ornithinimicrobium kibberense]|uniref:hypothetical protein n=1 Tax=Ornithinimicrobium kibberense TaxID=282060 RepID=UPI003611342F
MRGWDRTTPRTQPRCSVPSAGPSSDAARRTGPGARPSSSWWTGGTAGCRSRRTAVTTCAT